jgi:ABC-2 type transport system ATP-binding protein
MKLVVETEGLCRDFGARRALDRVSLSVPEGEMFGLLGPNGSGKTTLFRILSTLLSPTSGAARVAGYDAGREAVRVREHIGVVFQSPALDPQLTVAENLRCAGNLYGLGGADLEQRLQAAAGALDVRDRLDDIVQTLSGGLRRRVEIAKCVLPRPRVLLLDEPSTGLDPSARAGLRELLSRLRRETGVTIVMTTHLLDEAEACDRVAVLHRGRLVAEGKPAALRGKLGADVAVICGRDPRSIAERVRGEFGWSAQLRDGKVRVAVPADGDGAACLVAAMAGVAETVTVGRPTLEDVFLELTGETLRGGGEE